MQTTRNAQVRQTGEKMSGAPCAPLDQDDSSAAHARLSAARWRPFTLAFVCRESANPGVYELGDDIDDVVYIGSAADLRRCLQEHFNAAPTSHLLRNAVQYRVAYASNYEQRGRALYEEYVRHHGRPPMCNSRGT